MESMTKELLDGIAILNSFLEVCALLKAAECFLGKRTKRCPFLQWLLILIILTIHIYVDFFQGNRIFLLFHHICIAFILYIQYELEIPDIVIYTAFCFLGVGLSELIFYIPFNILYSFLEVDIDFSLFIVLLTYFTFYFIEKKGISIHWKRYIEHYLKKINPFVLGIMMFFVLAFLINRLNFREGMELEEGVYFTAAILIFVVLMHKLSKERLEMELHREYTKTYEDLVSEIRSRQHKFMNQMDSIYALYTVYYTYEELVAKQKEELEHLKQYMIPNGLLILDRPLVISHIYHKLCEAEENQINVQTKFSCSIASLQIPDIFLIELLGNLIDNAMEEVLIRGLGEKILLSITNEVGNICFCVGNEHDKISHADYQKFFLDGYSTKGQKRGLGLPYVKRIVHKFHGEINVGNEKYQGKNYVMFYLYFDYKRV